VVGDGIEQAAGVGVLWALQDFARWTVLNDSTRVHDRDPIGEAGNDREVMRHVDHRYPHLGTQPHELIKQPRLCDDVQARSWFVENDHGGFADERDRDAHALLLPPR
jgi:hypothetical protein